MLSLILLGVAALTYLFRRCILALITPGGIPGLPSYPDPIPIFGDLPRVVKSVKANHSFRIFFDGVGKDLGPIAQVKLGPGTTFVILSDYQEIESVFARHADFDRAAQTTEIFDLLIPTAQISQRTNTMWKHHRRLIGSAMSTKYLGMTVPRANEAVDELVDLFEAKIDKSEGKPWQVEGDMIAATMDVICGMAFGDSWGIVRDFAREVRSSTPKNGTLDEAIFATEMPPLAVSTIALLDSVPVQATFPRLTKLQTRLSPTYNRHRRLVFGYIDTKLAEARNRAASLGEAAVELADNTLDMMVAREMRGDTMTDAELKDEIFLCERTEYESRIMTNPSDLVAGTETSAVTMSWHKLRHHLQERLPQPVTAESLSPLNAPYLEAVVQETLRLSRTAGGTTRQAKRDTVVLGHVLPKGTTVVIPSAFQTEEEGKPAWSGPPDQTTNLDGLRSGEARKVGYWAKGTGLKFDPDRWMRDGQFDANAGPSAPFGLGQRGCFGKNLALLELRLLIARLTLAFYFAPVEDRHNSMEIWETITGHPRQSFIRPERWPSAESTV